MKITTLAQICGVGVTYTGQYFISLELVHRVGSSMRAGNLNCIEVAKDQAKALTAHVEAGGNPHFNVTLEPICDVPSND